MDLKLGPLQNLTRNFKDFRKENTAKVLWADPRGDNWGITNNEEFKRSIKGEDIVKFIKAQMLRWLGHVKRMEVGAMPRKMMEGRLFIGRRKGRLRLRWMDDDIVDLKVMKIKQWMEKTKDREQWRLVVEEAKVHPGLQRTEDKLTLYLRIVRQIGLFY
jgi:hypothetical protein